MNDISYASMFLLASTISYADTEVATKPARAKSVVLVHGAFADGSSWSKVIPLLEAKGLRVVSVQEPLSSLADDVAATKRAVELQDGPVILVGHSWGGVVITEAGNHDKVAGLVYVAAFAPDTGESVNDLGKDAPPPTWTEKLVIDSGGFARLPRDVVATEFAQDVSAREQALIASVQAPVAMNVFSEKVTFAAWRTKPSWYIRAEQDRMIDPTAQAAMAKRAGSRITNIRSSHVPMVSRPKEVAAVILAAAGAR